VVNDNVVIRDLRVAVKQQMDGRYTNSYFLPAGRVLCAWLVNSKIVLPFCICFLFVCVCKYNVPRSVSRVGCYATATRMTSYMSLRIPYYLGRSEQ